MTEAMLSAGYHALREGAAWIDLSQRGRLRITGEDRARLLHAMTTNQIQKLTPGQGCYAFFLNAQGRILGDANVFCFADHFLLDTEPETRTKLAEHLDRYIIADDVTVEDITGTTAAIAVEGPQAAATLSGLALSGLAPGIPLEPYGSTAWGSRTIVRVTETGAAGFRILAPLEEKPALLTQLAGIPEASAGDARTVRIEHGRPRYGEELTERYLVQETGQLHGVSFTKGCYLGQEIVERVRSRAQIHRLLRSLEIDSKDAPPAGAKLKIPETGVVGDDAVAGDAAAGPTGDVGEIVSAAYSQALGKVVAMAYVRVPYDAPGTNLSLNGVSARVVISDAAGG